jgi:hypothetical protein
MCEPENMRAPLIRQLARVGPWLGLLTLLLACPRPASAHSTGLSYLDLSVDGTAVRAALDLPVQDLAQPLNLDANGDGKVDDADIAARQPELVSWFGQNLRLSGDDQPCQPAGGAAELRDGTLLTLHQTYQCPAGVGRLAVESALGETVGAGYSVFVEVRRPGARADRALLRGDERAHTFVATSSQSATDTALEFVQLGLHHILTGYDHLLFLLTILVCGGSLGRLLGLASALTVANTLTLSLAATRTAVLPSRLTESAIAAFIGCLAVVNMFDAPRRLPGQQEPLGLRLRWLLACGFGLVHGSGFASTLLERGMPHAHLPLALGSFNVGVELGQIAIIAVSYPLRVHAGRHAWYRPLAVRVSSLGVLCVALYWLYRRTLTG